MGPKSEASLASVVTAIAEARLHTLLVSRQIKIVDVVVDACGVDAKESSFQAKLPNPFVLQRGTIVFIICVCQIILPLFCTSALILGRITPR